MSWPHALFPLHTSHSTTRTLDFVSQLPLTLHAAGSVTFYVAANVGAEDAAMVDRQTRAALNSSLGIFNADIARVTALGTSITVMGAPVAMRAIAAAVNASWLNVTYTIAGANQTLPALGVLGVLLARCDACLCGAASSRVRNVYSPAPGSG